MADQQRESQEFMAQQTAINQQMMEKFGNNPNPRGHGGNGQNKSRAKGRHPEKLERDVIYATFLHKWFETDRIYENWRGQEVDVPDYFGSRYSPRFQIPPRQD